MVTATELFLDRVISVLKSVRRIDMSGYTHSTLRRSVAVRMERVCHGDQVSYLQLLQASPEECDRLVEAVTINVSYFFRDPGVYEVLARDVLPEIIRRKQANGSKELRIWSAGCAAGEEPYSISILLAQALKGQRLNWSCLIFATDLDKSALERANLATYDRKQLKDTKLGDIDGYFTPDGNGYQVRPFIRNMVHFSWGDLTSQKQAIPAGSIFGSFDLVLCRNVLIYFPPAVQVTVFEQLNRSLAPDGYLVLGSAETLCRELAGRLQTFDSHGKIYRKPPCRHGASTTGGLSI